MTGPSADECRGLLARQGDEAAASPAARFRPWLLAGVTALCVCRPLFSGETAAAEGDGQAVALLWLVLAAVWFLTAWLQPRFEVRVGWIDLAALVLFGWHTVAAVRAAVECNRRPAINMLWEWLALAACYLLVRQLVVYRREARALAAVMLGVAVLLSVYGLFQVVYEMPRTRAEYAANPDQVLRGAGVWMPSDSPQRALLESRLGNLEPLGTFALTNSLAALLVPWSIVALGLCLLAWPRRKNDRRTLLAALAVAGLVLACLSLTKSRSAYLAVLVGAIIVWRGCRRQDAPTAADARSRRAAWRLRLTAAIGLLVVLACGLLYARSTANELWTKAARSLGYRLEYWRSSLAMIGDHAWLGVGPGNFQNAYTRYKLPAASEEIADPHNFLMEIWTTAGTPALVAMLGMLACLAASVRRGWVACEDELRPGGSATMILGGGAAGLLLAVPFGILSAVPPTFLGLAIGAVPALVCLGLLYGWMQSGSLPLALTAAGLVAMLVDLLAVGGIGFPGVAGSLWLLVALTANMSGGDRIMEVNRATRMGLFFAALCVLMLCEATGYGPVSRCRAALALARQDPDHADQHLRSAVQADPFVAQPAAELAAWSLDRWRQTKEPELFQQFERYNSITLERNPSSSMDWQAAGEAYFQAAELTRSPSDIQKANSAYQRAVELYPNNASLRAKWAMALLAIGDGPGFRREAAAALELDRVTPHEDKKLAPQVRDYLRKNVGR